MQTGKLGLCNFHDREQNARNMANLTGLDQMLWAFDVSIDALLHAIADFPGDLAGIDTRLVAALDVEAVLALDENVSELPEVKIRLNSTGELFPMARRMTCTRGGLAKS